MVYMKSLVLLVVLASGSLSVATLATEVRDRGGRLVLAILAEGRPEPSAAAAAARAAT